MDCLEAQALLSAMYDGERVDAAALAEAKEHCASCPDCAAFLEGLKIVGTMPTPKAPDEVITGVLAAVAAAAQDRANAERIEAMQREVDLLATVDALPIGLEPPASAADEPSTRPEWFDSLLRRFEALSDGVKWGSIGAVGAAVVTALVAFVLVSNGIGTPEAGTATSESTDQLGPTKMSGYGTVSAPAATANPQPATSTAPDYVAYSGHVYAPGALLADSSTATPTIGTIETAFATGGAPTAVMVYQSPVSDGSIVVAGTDGFRIYTPIIRRVSSKRYQLAAGNEVDRFGVWPTLPTRFAVPTAADGSPSFSQAGTDATNVTVYAATGQPLTSGFAVAPNTDANDPAAGNPNWTWWDPID